MAISTHKSDTEIFKKHFAKNIASDFEKEKCKCVLITLAKLCNEVKDGYSKSLDKIREGLLKENDPHVVQYIFSNPDCEKIMKSRRYLALNYGENLEGSVDDKKEITEEEWLEKEKKEIEEVEKTVTIRFANYTTLMRAQTLTQGLSAQLSMYLSGLTGGAVPKGEETEFTKKLLEKAGIPGAEAAAPNNITDKPTENAG